METGQTHHGLEEDPTIEAMLHGREKTLRLRLEVAAVQIIERLRIRSQNLQAISAEDLEIGTRMLNGESNPHGLAWDLERHLLDKRTQLERERRSQETECWRDLVGVVRDLLNAWEGLSDTWAKERFIRQMPDRAYENPYATSKDANTRYSGLPH